jgi:DNA-binding MarR family transcriptional regulator
MRTGHQLAMALRSAYWALHRQTDACLQPLGVTANQFVLLALLAEEDGVTQQELVQRASSDPNTVRAMLVALEEKGLVARRRHPTDGRAWSVTLSAKGRRTYGRLRAESATLRERLVSVFEPGEAEALIGLLGRIFEVMDPRECWFTPSASGNAGGKS